MKHTLGYSGLEYFAFSATAESFAQNPAFAQNADTTTIIWLFLAAGQPTPSEALITSYARSHSELQQLMLQVFSFNNLSMLRPLSHIANRFTGHCSTKCM
jgi:hypothetical protein